MDVFKKCSACDKTWKTREEFLQDAEIDLVGYQSTFTMSKPGLFLFNHVCESTIAIFADVFEDMSDEEIYQSCDAHLDNHPEHCCKSATGESELNSCVCKFAHEMSNKLRFMMGKDK